MRAFNFGTHGRARPAKREPSAQRFPVVCWCGRGRRFNSPAPTTWTPTRTLTAPRRPRSFTAASRPGDVAAREAAQRYKSAYWLNFLRCGQAGPLPAQPVIGTALNRPVSRCSAPMPPAGSAGAGAGRRGALQRLDLRPLVHTARSHAADGSRDNPTTSRTLASSPGSVENPKASVCQGLTWCSAHTRATVLWLIPSWSASSRRDQWSPQAPRSHPVDPDALRVDLVLERVGSGGCQVVLDLL
jgi:hypothetical protein